uniref:Uncharacterized protein n=1 Tax=Candidatus Kentrum sp. FM TaxID=2126340 RepID=A0A450SKJ2_9GAMM|nr:MAG: hypothetical protein BECKFM1743C_GA0114222_101336 [Candidatus Kentron sp. FM]VFJ54418.1 MAG: hypothetical protein BECKFM1743A_GA0114220_101315 [Candidatus Kentron sp. FM]VFK10864.1 MAG: hypothetical protein BECKFM1743B_GA0114221_101586 [Candidatus Kentron sp. FM]
MTDTKQTLTLKCCCEKKRQFHIHTEIDSGAGTHLVKRLVRCPFCENQLKLAIEANTVPVEHIIKGRGNHLDSALDNASGDKKTPRRRRGLRNRVFPTELAEHSE